MRIGGGPARRRPRAGTGARRSWRRREHFAARDGHRGPGTTLVPIDCSAALHRSERRHHRGWGCRSGAGEGSAGCSGAGIGRAKHLRRQDPDRLDAHQSAAAGPEACREGQPESAWDRQLHGCLREEAGRFRPRFRLQAQCGLQFGRVPPCGRPERSAPHRHRSRAREQSCTGVAGIRAPFATWCPPRPTPRSRAASGTT